MKRVIILLVILFATIHTNYAHNPLSARYNLDVKEGMSVLTINLSQTGLDVAIKKHYSKINIEELTHIEYKELAVKYLKENFELSINEENIFLLDGGIKLGNHQTDLKFVLTDCPNTIKNISVSIKAFSVNDNHQTIFSLLLNGKSSKVILNKNNNYEAFITVKDNEMILESETLKGN